MGKINNEVLTKMQERFNGCPLFVDREKGELDDLVGQKVKIDKFYELTGDNGVYYAVGFVGMEDKFFLSGGALTDLIAEFPEDCKNVEILIQEKIKTKNHREFRPIRVF